MKDYYLLEIDDAVAALQSKDEEIEIIGNIHENPDLLESEEK